MAAAPEQPDPARGSPVVAELTVAQFVQLERALVRVELEALAVPGSRDALVAVVQEAVRAVVRAEFVTLMTELAPTPLGALARQPRGAGRRRRVRA